MNNTLMYHNDLNNISMRNWTSEEMNVFFAIVMKIQEKGTEMVVIETDEIKELIQYTDRHKKRWEDILMGVKKNINQLMYLDETTKKLEEMPLFSVFEVNLDNKTITIKVSDDYEYIFNLHLVFAEVFGGSFD